MNEQKLNEVYEFMQQLKASATIPLEVDRAFSARLTNTLPAIALSGKGADSEDQSVDEGGAGTYSVMGDPVGFLSITIDGAVYCVPYFNA